MKRTFPAFIFAVLVLAACSGSPTQPARPTVTPIPPRPTPNAAELEISDPTKTIEVFAGGDFTIAVRARPLSSGFHWEVVEELNANIVAYVWKNFVPDDPGNPNSTGKDVWRFQAVGPGEITITLGYYEGETYDTVLKMAFTVVVK